MEVFKEFDFGIQIQSLAYKDEEEQVNIPGSRINFVFNKFDLKFDRTAFCHLLMIKSFFFYGTFNDDLEAMNLELEKLATFDGYFAND